MQDADSLLQLRTAQHFLDSDRFGGVAASIFAGMSSRLFVEKTAQLKTAMLLLASPRAYLPLHADSELEPIVKKAVKVAQLWRKAGGVLPDNVVLPSSSYPPTQSAREANNSVITATSLVAETREFREMLNHAMQRVAAFAEAAAVYH
eukprot:2006372-Rhodomonas_salina.1